LVDPDLPCCFRHVFINLSREDGTLLLLLLTFVLSVWVLFSSLVVAATPVLGGKGQSPFLPFLARHGVFGRVLLNVLRCRAKRWLCFVLSSPGNGREELMGRNDYCYCTSVLGRQSKFGTRKRGRSVKTAGEGGKERSKTVLLVTVKGASEKIARRMQIRKKI